ncbi:hypothetical protein EYE40_13865 [Glaciihabitans arcticus]|uniref:VIT family protein n=1 Tax=Glaciihabitans arcticus TaxID=2668039 RepID=A0A4Q9GUF6_9MICO|nr:hypothetical protein [Glaciihabitans arcticus]TBN58391.1 hypothetical protein EYE40_13865 [Glaciihabitans arcticus]
MTSAPSDRQEITERLKERIYVTFTALAVILAMMSHGEVTAGEAIGTLAIAVVGTLLAVFIADIIARIAANERLLSRQEFAHVAGVSLGAIGAVALPIVFLGVSAFGVWEPTSALRASAIALVIALVFFGFLAVRRARIPWWQRGLVLLALGVLGLAVIGLELLAHG